jgi:cytochrome P450
VTSIDDRRTAPPAPAAPDLAERVAVLRHALLPLLLGGVIKRNPAGMALAERRQWDAEGIRTAGRLRERHGPGPLPLVYRGRPVALVLDPVDARRLLDGTPHPFSPAADEKHRALSRFQPHGVLISDAADRATRRERNEAVLAAEQREHPAAERFLRVVGEEAGELLHAHAGRTPLGWQDFDAAWWRTVRRIVLGDAARSDTIVTDQLNTLRRDANLPLLPVIGPRSMLLRAAFQRRVAHYAADAGPQALAGRARDADAVQQIPHWLFAYDAAGMTVLRTLALLATHRTAADALRGELADLPADQPWRSPLLRGALLEGVRLWPTTPLLLRESAEETHWPGGTAFPAGTLFAVYAPYLHRGEPAGADADRFAPERWTSDADPAEQGVFVPFSAGPAGCPGRNLVLLTAGAWLAALLAGHDVRLLSHRLDPEEPLPATLNHFALRFALAGGAEVPTGKEDER